MSELDDVLHTGNQRIKDYQAAEIQRLKEQLDEAVKGLEDVAGRPCSNVVLGLDTCPHRNVIPCQTCSTRATLDRIKQMGGDE